MTFKKKMLILGCLAVVAAAGVGTSVAYVLSDATEVTGSLTADSGIIISWGDNSLEDITGLTANERVRQSVEIDWAKSESVTSGTIKTTFTFSTENTDLTVSIATTPFTDAETVALATLDNSETEYVAEIDLSTAEGTSATYYLEYYYTGTSETDASGALTIAVTYEQAITGQD